jgi:CelD/BcsL family acetyltransferase involved in cellulose biosynthesis
METFAELWRQTRSQLPWPCPFITPFWLETVVEHLGAAGDPLVLRVTRDRDLVGLLPLCHDGAKAFFLGIPDVCDYQDAVLAPGHEAGAMEQVLAYLSEKGIHRLELQTLRPDAALVNALTAIGNPDANPGSGGVGITRTASDVTYETELPESWEDYLMGLNGKQRHEVRRKLRRLETHGDYRYYPADPVQGLNGSVDRFLRLFHLNRKDKSRFMDETMGGYFRALIDRLAQHDLLRLYFLEVAGRTVASVLCFDYLGTRYLYNSGYDARYQELSVGILSKVFSIGSGIESGCRRYDFLKGAETYKKRIGGQERSLYRYEITL